MKAKMAMFHLKPEQEEGGMMSNERPPESLTPRTNGGGRAAMRTLRLALLLVPLLLPRLAGAAGTLRFIQPTVDCHNGLPAAGITGLPSYLVFLPTVCFGGTPGLNDWVMIASQWWLRDCTGPTGPCGSWRRVPQVDQNNRRVAGDWWFEWVHITMSSTCGANTDNFTPPYGVPHSFHQVGGYFSQRNPTTGQWTQAEWIAARYVQHYVYPCNIDCETSATGQQYEDTGSGLPNSASCATTAQ